MSWQGKRIAIYGLGRSGLACVRAAVALGAQPVVFDRSRLEDMTKPEVVEATRQLGVEIHLGWSGDFEAGFHWLVTNPSVDMRSEVLRRAEASGAEILSEIELGYRVLEARFGSSPQPPPSVSGQADQDWNSNLRETEGWGLPPLVAVTGTNGKSTTTVMTYLALRECGIDAVLCGNIFGSGLPEMPLTEAALHAGPEQVLVAEISSFQLEWVSRFRPAVAGITNIAPDHLDRYDTFEQYSAMKHRIFAAMGTGDTAVVRAYDPQVRAPGSTSTQYRRRPPSARADTRGAVGFPSVLTFGAQGEHAQVSEDEIRILDKSLRTEGMQVLGTHNHANAAMAGLLAYAAIRCLALRRPSSVAGSVLREAEQEASIRRASKRTVFSGRDPAPEASAAVLPEPILTALGQFSGIAHRMEAVGSKNGIRIINNSMCTNPEAVVKSAQAVKGPNHLIIGGKDKVLGARAPAEAGRPDTGESSSKPWQPVKNYLASGMHRAYLYGESKDLLNAVLGGHHSTYNTMQDAFRAATEKARPGEVIMLAPGCASTDQFDDFRERGNVFKKIAKEWLES